jgi:hypothetical protein
MNKTEENDEKSEDDGQAVLEFACSCVETKDFNARGQSKNDLVGSQAT